MDRRSIIFKNMDLTSGRPTSTHSETSVGEGALGEYLLRVKNHACHIVVGMQGGVDLGILRTATTCKHYAGYDVEQNRFTNNVILRAQDHVDYFMPLFKIHTRDAKAEAIMCPHNVLFPLVDEIMYSLTKKVPRVHPRNL